MALYNPPGGCCRASSADSDVLLLPGRGGGRGRGGDRGGRGGKPRLSIDASAKGSGNKVTFD